MTTKPWSGRFVHQGFAGKIAMRAVVLALLTSAHAHADPFKLHIACTATSDCASAMVARDEGIFAKHGFDADMTLIGINTNIPPAIVSDSIQIGGPTATVRAGLGEESGMPVGALLTAAPGMDAMLAAFLLRRDVAGLEL